jgi:hypothetical protein
VGVWLLYSPFYTWAGFHASTCAEGALKRRLGSGTGKPLTLKQMLDAAVDQGILSAHGFTRVKDGFKRRKEAVRLMRELTGNASVAEDPTPEALEQIVRAQVDIFRQRRNSQAHPSGFSYGLPNWGCVSLEIARDLILQIFPEEAAHADDQERKYRCSEIDAC